MYDLMTFNSYSTYITHYSEISFFQDSLALVRLDDLYLESFDVTDGKILSPNILYV